MKNLQDYKEQAQTNLFNKYGVFFAFSNEQLKEGYNKVKENGVLLEGEKLMSLPHGMYAPSKNVNKILDKMEKINKKAIAQDIEENGKDKIIARELYNYECFMTFDITDAKSALKPYGFTDEEIGEVFAKELPEFEKHN